MTFWTTQNITRSHQVLESRPMKRYYPTNCPEAILMNKRGRIDSPFVDIYIRKRQCAHFLYDWKWWFHACLLMHKKQCVHCYNHIWWYLLKHSPRKPFIVWNLNYLLMHRWPLQVESLICKSYHRLSVACGSDEEVRKPISR